MADREQWTVIGRVRSVSAPRRELRIEPLPAHAHEFDAELAWLRLRPAGDAAPQRLRVAGLREGGGAVVVTLAPGVPRDRLHGWRGAEAVVATEEVRPRPEDFWPPGELPGLAVVAQNGTPLGTVSGVYDAGGQTTITVARPDGGALLVPVIAQAVNRVDPGAGVIELGDYGPYAVEEA